MQKRTTIFGVAAVGLLALGAGTERAAAQTRSETAACAAAERFEDSLPWTFQGVTYPSRRYFSDNFRCGSHTHKFAKQSFEELDAARGLAASPAMTSATGGAINVY
jgi:hypothetical protein